MADHDLRPGVDVSAREVYDFAQALSRAGDYHGWAEMFADDGYFEMPLISTSYRRVLTGPDEVKRHLVPAQRRVREAVERRVVDRPLFTTDDPQVLVCELTLARSVPETGEECIVPFLQIIRIADGRFASYRDFMSFELALGNVPTTC